MKTLTAKAILVMAAVSTSRAQSATGGQEIVKIHAGLEQAFIKKGMTYFEGVLAPDYVHSNPQGKMYDRAGSLIPQKERLTENLIFGQPQV